MDYWNLTHHTNVHNRGTYHNHRMLAHSRYGSVGGKRIYFIYYFNIKTNLFMILYIYIYIYIYIYYIYIVVRFQVMHYMAISV